MNRTQARSQTAELRAFRAQLSRRRTVLVVSLVTAIVSLVGLTSWLLRPRSPGFAPFPGQPMLADLDKPGQPPIAAPRPDPNLYSAHTDARSEILSSLRQARLQHKRILLDFGGDWCADCQVLDIYLHQAPNLQLLEQRFLLVHVDIGKYDKNVDLAERYGVPLQKGVPALVVLAEDGRELFAQTAGEFEAMRRMDPQSVTAFLERWKN